MTTYTHSTTQLTMAHIALGLDAPPAPPKLPPDPAQAITECEAYLMRCLHMLERAQNDQERRDAELWVWNAEGELRRWKAVLQRQGVRS